MKKTLDNTTSTQAKAQVSDFSSWGDSNTFLLISKASSWGEGWMKSTKAMEIQGVGCVIQVTTQQGGNIAEALTFVPGVRIDTAYTQSDGVAYDTVISRTIVKY